MDKHNQTSHSNFNLTRIIQVDDPQVQSNVKTRIKEKLLQQAEYLLDKKKKQQQKKQRIKKLQQSLQAKRQRKLKTIIQKQNKSQIVMQKNRKTQQKKFKQHQDYFKQVLNNHQRKYKQHIQNAIHKQKQFQTQKSRVTEKMQKNLTHKTIQKTLDSSRYLDNSRFFRLSQQLQNKTKKAQQNHQKFNKSIIDRLRQKSESISHAQQKALARTMLDESQSLKSWGRKAQTIENVHQSKRSQRQKKLLARKQSFRFKLDKCNQNLKYIQNKQQQKTQKLQNKLFDRKFQPKQWKDLKLQKYWNLWQQNSKIIESKLSEQANKILQKHQLISQQNRVYKQKKQKLMQVIKQI